MKKITLKPVLTGIALIASFALFSQNQKVMTLQERSLNNIDAQKALFVYPNSDTERSPSGVIKCATVEYGQYLESQNSSRMSSEQYEEWIAPKIAEIKAARLAGKKPAPYVIPVVVHVIHNGDAVGSGENITNAQVISQIDVFNDDFGKMNLGNGAGVDTGISFCFAQVDPDGNVTNGITRTNLGQVSWDSMADIDDNLKPATIWDPTKYLNLWTCRFGGGMASTLGYAQFPTGSGQAGMPNGDCDAAEASSDGVISAYDTFGSRVKYPAGTYGGTSYDEGRTMTHELGHMLGLRHIWGDSTACTNDDFCADTPDSDAANFGCANTDSCTGDGLGNDQVENYMDYSDDSCMDMFTQDQTDRMIATLENADRRVGLLNSTVCNPVPTIQFTGSACESTSKNVIEPTTGCNAFSDISIPLEIDMVANANTLVTFSVNGASTGVEGVDFDIVFPTVTFNLGDKTGKNLILRVYNDDFTIADKTAIIDFVVAPVGNAVANLERDSYTVNLVNNDVVPNPLTVSTIFAFTSDTTGWSVINADGNSTWGVYNAGINIAGVMEPNFLGNQDADNTANDYFISPEFTIPAGTSSLSITQALFAVNAAQDYELYFSPNAINEANVLAGTLLSSGAAETYTGSNSLSTINLDAFLGTIAGQTGSIVMRHIGSAPSNDGYLMWDTISVSSSAATEVQTAVNTGTPDSDYLAAAGSVYAFNAADGNVMADITNTNGVNYGCVSTSVSRASGTAQIYQVAGAVNFVTDKTFTITPAAPQSSGTATLKFYFTEAEIVAWEGATGNVRGDLTIIKDNGVTQETVVATIGAFGSDMTLQGTFSTGIDGTYYFGRATALGVANNDFSLFNVFPNPTNGSVNITLSSNDDVQVSLFDIRGRQVYTKVHNNNSATFNEVIDFSAVSAGVYLLNVESGDKRATKKLVIQ